VTGKALTEAQPTGQQWRVLRALCAGTYGDFGNGYVITPRDGVQFKPAECERIDEGDIERLVDLGLVIDRRGHEAPPRHYCSCCQGFAPALGVFLVGDRAREALAAAEGNQ
jgi:hypothetical protein